MTEGHIMKRFTLATLVFLSTFALGVVIAQQAVPPSVPSEAPQAVAAPTPPQVAQTDMQAFSAGEMRSTGLQIAMAVLQKELDAVNAENARLVDRLVKAQPEYNLTRDPATGRLVYQPKPKAEKK